MCERVKNAANVTLLFNAVAIGGTVGHGGRVVAVSAVAGGHSSVWSGSSGKSGVAVSES